MDIEEWIDNSLFPIAFNDSLEESSMVFPGLPPYDFICYLKTKIDNKSLGILRSTSLFILKLLMDRRLGLSNREIASFRFVRECVRARGLVV